MPPPPPPTTTSSSSPIPIPIRLDKPVPPLPPAAMTVSNMHSSTTTASATTTMASAGSNTSNNRRRPSADQHHSHHHHFFPSRSSSAHSHKLSSSPSSSSSSSPMLMFRSIVAVVKDKFSSSSGSSSHDRSHGSPGSDSGLSSTPPHTMSSISSSSIISQSETSISTIGSSRSIPLSQASARRPSGDVQSSTSFSFAALSSPPASPAPLLRAIPVPPGSPKPTGAPLASLDGIPDLVRESFAYIERHGATVEGIYRTACPGADLLAEWAAQFDSKSGRRMVPRDLDAEYAPDAVAQAVKNYFKALPEEVIAPRHVVAIWDLIHAEKQRAAALAAAGGDAVDSGTDEDAAAASLVAKKATMVAIRAYVRANLIRPHRLMLAAVLRHLQVMAGHADKTRVTAKTLSMLWPAVVCCPHATAHSMEVIEEAMFLKAQAPGPFEWMIENAKEMTVGW
ncbi:hypothetical protein BCR44DRAFT_1427994 [Catenaria anguillulae PL171]|uniref:Rho-GAP domain-containing protein n=1 Tax=Catenaria anguillulae PL171 TaxID=765915 RepID=A0A1Y2HWB0_9FUNG|nr:hypothetical protein BCR44DRAFT_1427994 [Catenaria anguillulae PL171]